MLAVMERLKVKLLSRDCL